MQTKIGKTTNMIDLHGLSSHDEYNDMVKMAPSIPFMLSSIDVNFTFFRFDIIRFSPFVLHEYLLSR